MENIINNKKNEIKSYYLKLEIINNIISVSNAADNIESALKTILKMTVASKQRAHFTSKEKDILQLIGKEIGSIISRIKSEELLRESEEKYRKLIDHAGPSITYWDLNFNLMYANNNAEKDFCANKENLIGKTLFDLFPKDATEFYKKHFNSAVKKTNQTFMKILYLAQQVINGFCQISGRLKI